MTEEEPPIHRSMYPETQSLRLIGHGRVSDDNGLSWTPYEQTPKFEAGLPYGYRRSPFTPVVEPNTGRLITFVNAMDTPDVDPNEVEPPIALQSYYLRYRVSEDGGQTWLFDEPVVHAGKFTRERPFEGVHFGQNSFFLGDIGSTPIVTAAGRILVPAQGTILGADGQLLNPLGQTTYSDVFVIIGTRDERSRLRWTASSRVQVDLDRSTRGMIEPTLIEFNDGGILMVMRGSNGGKPERPAYKWVSVSRDGGETWTEPAPWTYEDGRPFFSPSSMSTLLKHSSGRVFWVGNVSESNCNGNSPRWPVVIGEVDLERLTLMRNTVLEVDTRGPEDEGRGRLDLSHLCLLEDRETNEIVLTYPRSYNRYTSCEWVTVRLSVT